MLIIYEYYSHHATRYELFQTSSGRSYFLSSTRKETLLHPKRYLLSRTLKWQNSLKYHPVKGDASSQSFLLLLNRLFSLTSQANSRNESQELSKGDAKLVKPDDFQIPPINSFGDEELTLLENEAFKGVPGLNLSDWVYSLYSMFIFMFGYVKKISRRKD